MSFASLFHLFAVPASAFGMGKSNPSDDTILKKNMSYIYRGGILQPANAFGHDITLSRIKEFEEMLSDDSLEEKDFQRFFEENPFFLEGIAQEVAETKEKHDARVLFNRAKRLMGKQPKTIITDGLRSYSIASDQVFDGAKHIRHIRLQGDKNNNKMERLNGEIRDREKTMRGLKKKYTPILSGYQIYHNYIRPHQALGGKTPAEACGIKVEGKNKWLTLIQNASKKR